MADTWLCTEEASQVRGNAVLACGVAIGSDENDARTKAFENAKAEFMRVCSESDVCNNRQITVEPNRTSCNPINGAYKCYRLVTFNIGEGTRMPANMIPPSSFNSFRYESTAKMPKVFKGMRKKDLLLAFGEPSRVESFNGDNERLMLLYNNSVCQSDWCYVIIKKDKVTKYVDFKASYTDYLK